MVFQDYALFPHLDVGHNVAFGIHHLPRIQRTARAWPRCWSWWAWAAPSGATRTNCPAASSSAWRWPARWRPHPQLLLLDEPFSNLDVDLRERLAHEVRGILKAAKATALFVTHDQLEAFAIGDVIGVMHEGPAAPVGRRLHAVPPPGHAVRGRLHRPRRVHARPRLREVGNQVVVQTALGELTDMAECPLPGAFPSGRCDVLLRADDIVHDDDAPVKAQIIRKSFRGSEFLYTLRLHSGRNRAGPRAQSPRPQDR
jgi:iron(III) transport system ATP-binding protein